MADKIPGMIFHNLNQLLVCVRYINTSGKVLE